ncbi:MAG: DNA/RNA non-specific endonuclease [Lachnospiraceae bacterium]|nr:DNA/RNA non-specific endonuclease [Lachnospiraceae bacterium]
MDRMFQELKVFRKIVYRSIFAIFVSIFIFLGTISPIVYCNAPVTVLAESKDISLSDIPPWQGISHVIINNNAPVFSKKQMRQKKIYIKYSHLDMLGRAGTAIGCLGKKTLNNEPRNDISSIRPSGWNTKKYPKLINDRYVYNRCHLIMQAVSAGIKPAACNGPKNLITGTRYLNIDGMLAFENRLLNYIRSTGNHVIYRVKPLYQGHELVARGVQMEAYSIEDDGKGLMFNVFCYNVQPGIRINYATGKTEKKNAYSDEIELALANGSSTVSNGSAQETEKNTPTVPITAGSSKKNTQRYVLNTNSRKIHLPSCPSVKDIAKEHKLAGYFSKKALIKQGYSPCGRCHP